MPTPGIYALVGIACAYVFRAKLIRAFAVVAATTVLVPGPLVMPGTPPPYLTVTRTILLAMAIRLLFDLRRGTLDASAFRLTPVHVAFFGFLIVVAFVGIARTTPEVTMQATLGKWILFFDQFLFLVVSLAVFRAVGNDERIMWIVVGILVVSAGIGVTEHLVRRSWGAFLSDRLPRLALRARRGGEVRVRAGAEFALAYGWVCAMLLPFLVALTSRLKRALIVVPVLAGLVVTAIVFTFARTAVIGVGVVLLVLWLASSFDLRVGLTALAIAGAAAVVVVAVPSFADPFFSVEAQGSATGRSQRLPFALGLVSDEPLLGRGIGALTESGVDNFDSTFFGAYAEMGVVGVIAVVILLGTAGFAVTRGLRAPREDRLLPAAALAAVIAGIGAAASFDLFTVFSSPKLFWLAVAVGAVAAERRFGPQPVVRRPTRRRVAVPLAAAGIGLIVLLATPAHTAATMQFSTLSPAIEQRTGRPPTFPGNVLLETYCLIVDITAERRPDVKVECRPTFRRVSPGVGHIRVEGRHPDVVRAALTELHRLGAEYIAGFRWALFQPLQTERPSWARTAPIWASLVALAGALLWPPPSEIFGPRLRRRGSGRREATEEHRAVLAAAGSGTPRAS